MLVLVASVVWMGTTGCGLVDEVGASPTSGPGSQAQGQSGINGLSTNGLSTNGLSTNGLSTNGLSTNGLSTNGFKSWFESNPSLHDAVMRYVVLCAVPAGESRSYTDSRTGKTYTWSGGLGLAPDWASGSPASVVEQQVISACLAAHANKYGLHLPISVLGRDAKGKGIPYTAQELSTYSETEACFFGNLFNGEGIFVGSDRRLLSDTESSARACGFSGGDAAVREECPPLVHVGSCESRCTLHMSGLYYTGCTYNGRTYHPITTRLRPEEIYTCGDGTCQFTEKCGSGTQYNNCLTDCGLCPGSLEGLGVEQ